MWAKDFLKYGYAVDVPKKGDLVILQRGKVHGHVGFFVRYITDKSGIRWVGVLGGNTGSEGSGDVSIGYYPLDKVLGYRRYHKNFVRWVMNG